MAYCWCKHKERFPGHHAVILNGNIKDFRLCWFCRLEKAQCDGFFQLVVRSVVEPSAHSGKVCRSHQLAKWERPVAWTHIP